MGRAGVGLGIAFFALRDVLFPCVLLPFPAIGGAKGTIGVIFVRRLTIGSHCSVVYCLGAFEILGGKGGGAMIHGPLLIFAVEFRIVQEFGAAVLASE